MKLKQVIIFIIFTICSTLLFPEIEIDAVKIKSPLKIDGIMNEPDWQNSRAFSNFKMIEPDTGKTPSEKTSLKVLYDNKNIYFGIFCYDTNPSAISCNSMQRDQRGEDSDAIKILLDSFMDKRSAYLFYVNPKGAKSDGIASGERADLSWDGIWDAKTAINKDGWCIEIKIPFKTISFNPNINSWGINVERWIPRKMEKIRMEGISIDSFFNNPNIAAKLNNIEKIKQGSGLTIRPFVTFSSDRDFELGQERKFELKFGGEIYKSFTPNLKGVFSYNTEFAETEADTRQINLTRFSMFYPEKRGFFLEGSEIFNFGIGIQSSYRNSFVPFFSRRIGINDDGEVPILFGAKVFGKIKNTNLALLDVQTKKFNGISAKNFIAGRISQNIFSQSKVGMIFTDGNPDGLSSNRLLGFDFTYSTSTLFENKNFQAGAWYVYNWNEQKGGNHEGYGFKIDYPNDLIDASITFNHFGDSLNPGLGFLPRSGIRSLMLGSMIRPRPAKGLIGKLIRRFNLYAFGSLYWSLDGKLETASLYSSPLNFTTESGEQFQFNFNPKQDTLNEPFEVSEGVIIQPDEYRFTRYQMELKTAQHRTISSKIKYEFGSFYSGNLDNLQLSLNFKLNGHINLEMESQFIHGNLPEGNFKKNLYRLKADFYLSPDIGLMNYLQYDDQSNLLGVSMRFKYQLSPGNILYLAVNKNWEKQWDPASRFLPLQDRTVIKLVISFSP